MKMGKLVSQFNKKKSQIERASVMTQKLLEQIDDELKGGEKKLELLISSELGGLDRGSQA